MSISLPLRSRIIPSGLSGVMIDKIPKKERLATFKEQDIFQLTVFLCCRHRAIWGSNPLGEDPSLPDQTFAQFSRICKVSAVRLGQLLELQLASSAGAPPRFARTADWISTHRPAQTFDKELVIALLWIGVGNRFNSILLWICCCDHIHRNTRQWVYIVSDNDDILPISWIEYKRTWELLMFLFFILLSERETIVYTSLLGSQESFSLWIWHNVNTTYMFVLMTQVKKRFSVSIQFNRSCWRILKWKSTESGSWEDPGIWNSCKNLLLKQICKYEIKM